MITFKTTGDFKNTDAFLLKLKRGDMYSKLEKYAQIGVDALAENTPVDSGKTASSWTYEIHRNGNSVEIVWINTNINQGVPIAVLIQYGHGLNNGGYVQGIDYINPAMKPVFDEIAEAVWKEVTTA